MFISKTKFHGGGGAKPKLSSLEFVYMNQREINWEKREKGEKIGRTLFDQ